VLPRSNTARSSADATFVGCFQTRPARRARSSPEQRSGRSAPRYSHSVRNVPESVKRSVYGEYGIASHVPRSYEVDHLVSLELGGNNSVANLWPEISPGYHEKDGIENRLHHAVCSGSVSLRTAQRQIARDWRHTAVGAPTASKPQKWSAPSAL
jgi:hypothetical protein